jgi:hypothetical protein
MGMNKVIEQKKYPLNYTEFEENMPIYLPDDIYKIYSIAHTQTLAASPSDREDLK